MSITWKHVIKANVRQILFVCGAFLLMILIGCIAVARVIQQEVQSTVTVALNETEKALRSYLKEPKIAFHHIYLTLQDMLDGGDSQEDVYAYFKHVNESTLSPDSDVMGFFGVYGVIRDEFIDSVELNLGKAYVPQQRPWYQMAIRSKGATYTAPYLDIRGEKTVISLVRKVYGKNGDYYGVLAMDIDLLWMIDYAKALSLTEGGYGMIINQYFYIIAHPEGTFKHLPLQALGTGYASIVKMLRGGKNVSAQRITDFDDTQVMVFFRKLYYGWYVGVAMPARSYYETLYETALFLIVLGAALSMALSFLLLRLSAAKMKSDTENRSKSSFLAMMSHEIRTPLNAIIGMSEIQLQKRLPEPVRKDIATIYTAGSSLLSIINDILDFSKLEAGGLTLVPVQYDVPSLISDTVRLNAVRTARRPITLEIDVDPTLPTYFYGDELRIKQILNNLLSNAIKYTNEGRVTLTANWKPHGKEMADVSFIVSDTGIGIKKADMERLFSEYRQVDLVENRKREGTGLGLVITKRLVQTMNGVIRVESEYGRGSTFTVTILQTIMDASPIGETVAKSLQHFRFAEERRSRRRVTDRVRMPNARVLVVDDIITNLDVARGLLKLYGMNIDCVQSGREAVERIKSAIIPYDAIFMDHMMPEMDGIEATRIIRNDIGTEYAKNIPIIALTANALAGNSEMFLSRGFNAFISKPIDTLQLDEVVKTWIESRQPDCPLPAQSAEDTPPDKENTKFGCGFCDFQFVNIDRADLLRRYNNNTAVCLSVLKSYAKYVPALLDRLRHPTEATLTEYAVTVHGLKGCSLGVGATGVGNAAAALETLAKDGDIETIMARNNDLIIMADAVLVELGNFLTQENPLVNAEKSACDPLNTEVRTKLLDACRRFNTLEMRDLIVTLEKTAHTTPADADLAAWLRKQVDAREYDAIQKRLEKELAETES